jgi:hypothetical protein
VTNPTPQPADDATVRDLLATLDGMIDVNDGITADLCLTRQRVALLLDTGAQSDAERA